MLVLCYSIILDSWYFLLSTYVYNVVTNYIFYLFRDRTMIDGIQFFWLD